MPKTVTIPDQVLAEAWFSTDTLKVVSQRLGVSPDYVKYHWDRLKDKKLIPNTQRPLVIQSNGHIQPSQQLHYDLDWNVYRPKKLSPTNDPLLDQLKLYGSKYAQKCKCRYCRNVDQPVV